MIKSLTSLRGIFILFIFLHHCMNLYPGGGTMAVSFFFVLGGFSMTLGYKDRILSHEFNYRQYLVRRCIKFYPLHWLCLLLAVPFTIVIFKWTHVPVFFANACLAHTLLPLEKLIFSYNAVSWYLANTMFFAVMFPLIFNWIASSTTRGRIMIAALFACVYAIVAILLPVEKYHAFLYASPYMRLTDFVFGIYLALLYFKLKEQPAKWWNRAVVSQLLIFAIIALLVVESCILSDEARLFAPVYWVLIGVVIIVASLSGRIGGGKIYLKTKYCNALAN